jgi:hypothetical protein
MGKFEQKNIKNDKRTHFEKHKNEHKPINNNQLHKLPPDRPKKNEPISLSRRSFMRSRIARPSEAGSFEALAKKDGEGGQTQFCIRLQHCP